MKDANVAQTGYSSGQERSFEQIITLNAPGNSDWIRVPERVKFITVQIQFTGGAGGKMQTTAALVNTINTGSPDPEDWKFGIVYDNRTEVCKPVSGIRAVQVGSGTMEVNIRFQ